MIDEQRPSQVKVCVVGSGPRFLSGISYYTNRLVHTFATRHTVSVILIRKLLPARFYPGRSRVGKRLVKFDYPPGTPVVDGIDWYWGRSLFRSWRQLIKEQPDVLVLQWWSAAVLHTYIVLALTARSLGARVVIEFHEVLDTGEQRIAPIRWYGKLFVPLLVRLAHGAVVHNEFDRRALEQNYRVDRLPVVMAPHGPYDQYGPLELTPPDSSNADVCRLLYFGVIRPFKGVEDLVGALDAMDDEEAARFVVTIVGETWENWTLPAEMIANSRHRDRIEFVNRYVSDEEVPGFFSRTDAVVLPYHRSSASGPLHLAMAYGLPVVVTEVGGLVEATGDYAGALRVPPSNPEAIRSALHEAAKLKGQRFADLHSWDRTLEGYESLFALTGVRTDR
jgi:glycosyltransferase involved in cell wall biosynthesis